MRCKYGIDRSVLRWITAPTPLVFVLTIGLGCDRNGAAATLSLPQECPPCRIIFHNIVSLGAAADPISLGQVATTRVELGPKAEYLVYELFRGNIIRYDSVGKFVGTLGRPGRGPGEFRWIWALTVDQSDSVIVFDRGNGRMEIFSPSAESARSVRFPYAVAWFEATSEGLMVHGRQPDSIRQPDRLHLMSKDGSYLRGIDSPLLVTTKHGDAYTASILGAPSKSGVVVLDIDPPRLSIYNSVLTLQDTIRIHPTWYPGPAVPTIRYDPKDGETPVRTIAQRPPRGFRDMYVDANDRVWLLAMVEAPHWDKISPRFGTPGKEGTLELMRFWVAQVEVYDGTSGSLLASSSLPFFALNFLRDGTLARPVERADGLIVIEIYKLTLQPE